MRQRPRQRLGGAFLDKVETDMARLPKFKPDAKGVPRYMPARYILRRDPGAKAAYRALRRRGLSRADAERQIEFAFYESFVEVLIHEGSDWREADRRPEIWALLAEGLSIERIFPELSGRYGHN
jgi:hypothetical protein